MKKITDFTNLIFVDLTHPLSSDIPSWSGGCGFQYKVTSDYDDYPRSDAQFRVQSVEMQAGIGTHMDAPAHCIPGALDIGSISLEQLIAPCVVINVADKAHEAYCVSLEDIELFETNYGTINKNSFIIINTGWDKFWSQPDMYRNNLIFPTISVQAAELLLDRNIVGLGIDTLSPDNEASGFGVHKLFLGSGKYIVENIANASLVPAIGAYTLALPLKIQHGTESPIRLIAAIPMNN